MWEPLIGWWRKGGNTEFYYQFLCWRRKWGRVPSTKLLRFIYALVLRVHIFKECLITRGRLFCSRSLFSQSVSDMPRFLRRGNNQALRWIPQFGVKMPVLKPEDVSFMAPVFIYHGVRIYSSIPHKCLLQSFLTLILTLTEPLNFQSFSSMRTWVMMIYRESNKE